MTNSTSDPAPRFAPLTALLVGLLVTGLYYIVSTVALVLEFSTFAATGDIEDADDGDVGGLTMFVDGYFSEPPTVVVAVVSTLAGAVGFFALKRSDRISSLSLSTLMVGVAIAAVIGFGVNFVVYWLLHEWWIGL